MRFFSSKAAQATDNISSSGTPPYHEETKDGIKGDVSHEEYAENAEHHKFQVSKTGDGDAAMALFRSPTEIHEPIDPDEERKLIRKIDLMILPYLAVCYAFFYIDKTTLSYAALFGIRTDLHLHGTQYSWLSSIFYFGFLAWALPTNLMLQRFPVGKYLGINIFAWGVFLMLQAAATVSNLSK